MRVHIYALIVNLMPSFFNGKSKTFMAVQDAFWTVVDYLLILLLSPVLLFRIFFPLDEQWKRKKRRMVQSDQASLLLERSGREECVRNGLMTL